MKDSGEWHVFRDVFEVNGEPVRDRDERLTKLFLNPSRSALDDATAIALEGARYNLGGAERTINNPLLVLAFPPGGLPAALPLFIEYRATRKPGRASGSSSTRNRRVRRSSASGPTATCVAKGRIWIESDSGRVVKTELAVTELDNIVTSFRFDERFQIAVPHEMREEFWTDTESIVGVASYSRFRRFDVTTEEEFQEPRTSPRCDGLGCPQTGDGSHGSVGTG